MFLSFEEPEQFDDFELLWIVSINFIHPHLLIGFFVTQEPIVNSLTLVIQGGMMIHSSSIILFVDRYVVIESWSLFILCMIIAIEDWLSPSFGPICLFDFFHPFEDVKLRRFEILSRSSSHFSVIFLGFSSFSFNFL